MNFDWEPGHVAVYDGARAFARGALQDAALGERDGRGEFWREGWDRCAAYGIAGCVAPAPHGGGLDFLSAVRLFEALGAEGVDRGLLFSIHAHLWGVVEPVFAVGTPAQVERWGVPLATGRAIGALAMSEPGSGSDAFGLRTSATQAGEGWVLNGQKAWVTNGPHAQVALVFARTAPGFLGVSAFLVPLDRPGVRVGRATAMMGLRTSPIGELWFEDVQLEAGERLGGAGAGAGLFLAAMQNERIGIMASVVGSMERQLAATTAHAKGRQAGGKPIAAHESVAFRVARMAERLELARLQLYKAAWSHRTGKAAAGVGALTKLVVSEAFVENSQDAIRVHGAHGLTVEAGLERDLRDAMAGLVHSGTSDVLRGLVARGLGLG